MQFIFLCTSIGAAILLTSSYSNSGTYDRSLIDILLSFALCACALGAIEYFRPNWISADRDSRNHYDAIPLNELRDADLPGRKARPPFQHSALSARNQSSLILIAILAVALRIELWRQTSTAVQCTVRSYQIYLPFLLALNECRYQERFHPHNEEEDDLDDSIYDAIAQKFKTFILQPKWRYVPSAFAISLGCRGVITLWQTHGSTYVCSSVSGERTLIPRLQVLSLLLDFLLGVIARSILSSNNAGQRTLLSFPMSTAITLLGAAICWSIYAIISSRFKPAEEQWILKHDNVPLYTLLWFMLSNIAIICTFLISTLNCIMQYGVYQISAILVTTVTVFAGVNNLWSIRHPYPPNTSNATTLSFLLLYLGAWSSVRVAQAINQIQPSRTTARQVLLLVIFLPLVYFGFWKYNSVYFHPIDLLMFEAKSQHEQYVEYASSSTDLETAVSVYQQRYNSDPPPGFDTWYEYARRRSVVIMDDYDQIYQDLLPFRAVAPGTLRSQTWEAVSNPWNGISGISIRGGKANVQENVIPTHRWMLDGVAILINSFAEYLPDMDIAFNLNDEPRVAVPYTKLESLRNEARQIRLQGRSTWSPDRASTWAPVAKEEYKASVLQEFSFQRNFHRFGTVACPPKSLSITRPYLSSQSHVCLKCAEPHSMGQFVSNWTLAADVCHQPDLSSLHGFYLSAAAFKSTHKLIPIFSQSKAHGFNDILYPSSWNYMDKVVYAPRNKSDNAGAEETSFAYPDPPFAEKENTLYWRGATTEGVSAGSGNWKGMTRQRLIHLVNNATSESDRDRTTILLPDPRSAARYRYYSLPGSALIHLGLQNDTDVKVVESIARCGGPDCADQAREFGLVQPVDFQAHWKYKFLLDMDGAGFSGRFIPFLQSHSLPFKTALFRQWYDSRVTAWRHFVPVDIRLHGFWSTLVYFAGVDGFWPGSNGKRYKWEAHTEQGEIIAREGRNWANKVLRKEDMEVYFFRLLLEWGRLTDDNRELLGFTLS